MFALIDNYDSFTYNLVQMMEEIGADIQVFRNDAITADELRLLKPSAIIISPGPGRPADAGNSKEIIHAFYKHVPILGVCLGHQALNEVFGGRTVKAKHLMHGKIGQIKLFKSRLFKDLPDLIPAGRYHSLEADRKTLPRALRITAEEDGEIMALEHREYPVFGLQFHPESILTPDGAVILRNFIELVKEAS